MTHARRLEARFAAALLRQAKARACRPIRKGYAPLVRSGMLESLTGCPRRSFRSDSV